MHAGMQEHGAGRKVSGKKVSRTKVTRKKNHGKEVSWKKVTVNITAFKDKSASTESGIS